MVYITASGSQTVANQCNGLLIQVNAALTGTITLQANGTTFAIISNPTVGTQYRYIGLSTKGPITVNPSASTDITVSFLNKNV